MNKWNKRNKEKGIIESPTLRKINKQEKGYKEKGKGPYVLAMIGCMLVLVLAMFLGTYIYVWLDEGIVKNTQDAAEAAGITDAVGMAETGYTQEQLEEQIAAAVEEAMASAVAGEAARILGGIEEGLSNGDTVVETLRPYYPDNIVVVSEGRFHFVPIREDLKKNNLVQENLTILESGEYQYWENGQNIIHKGIDVSRHQENIDWAKVSESGVEFAFIRIGYRGYGTGKIVLDEQFEKNIKGALGAGIKVGVYFFSQALNEEEALEEAAFVLDNIAAYKVECPVVFDVEKVTDSTARMNQLTVEERTNVTLAFSRAIEEAGYTPMIYHNMEMGALLLDMKALEGYDKWFAYYGSVLYYPYDYQVWQYSEKGTIEGIKGPVDLNISFKMWGD